jgi:pimeloyl-ACP methyl ester carboxylesterase
MLESSASSFKGSSSSSAFELGLVSRHSLLDTGLDISLNDWRPGSSYKPQDSLQDFVDPALLENVSNSNLVLGNEWNYNPNTEIVSLNTSISNDQYMSVGIDVLTGATKIAVDALQNFFTKTDYITGLQIAFGNNLNLSTTTGTVENLLTSYKNGGFTVLPSVELQPGSVMGQTNGAFSADNYKIYLNAQFAATASNEELANVLLEEYGHAIDTLLSSVDSEGDEGELFAKVVTAAPLDNLLINALKHEDDTTSWFLDEKTRLVEQSQIAMESFNGKLYQSQRGFENNKIYTRSSTDGVNWTNWQGSGGATSTAPALASLNGRLYESHSASDTNKIYTRSSTDGVNWTGWQESGGATSSAPALAALNGRLYQSHRGSDNQIYTRSSTDGVNWTGWHQAGGATSSAPSLEAVNGRLYQSHRGFDNQIHTRSSTNGVNWTAWQQAGGATPTAPSLASLNGRLYQTHQGLDNRIYTRSSTDGVNWTGWQQAGGETPTELNDLTVTRITSTGKTFDVRLNMFDGNGKTQSKGLDSRKDTIVVLHGWDGNDDSTIGNLAAKTAASNFYPNAQVITLDWRDGAADSSPQSASRRISAVARWGVDRLRELGIDRNKTILFGHSLGSYVAAKMGEFFGGVKEIVALDPAAGWTNWDMDGDQFDFQSVKNFRDVATTSTALVASDLEGGQAGDNAFASTANTSLIVSFSNYSNPTPSNPFQRDNDYHGAVVNVFGNQITRNLYFPSFNRNGWYSNSGLKRAGFNPITLEYSHEGVIRADLSDRNNPKISRLLYVSNGSSNESIITWA